MTFIFKLKFILILTIFSIIPGVQASENKRSNKTSSLLALGASAAIGHKVAYRIYKKYTRLPEKERQAIRSAGIGISIWLPAVLCTFSFGSNPTNDLIRMFTTTIATSVYVCSKFKLAPYHMFWGCGVGLYSGDLLDMTVKGISTMPIATKCHSMMGLTASLTGLAHELGLDCLVIQWYHNTKDRRKRQKILYVLCKHDRSIDTVKLILEFADMRTDDLEEPEFVAKSIK